MARLLAVLLLVGVGLLGCGGDRSPEPGAAEPGEPVVELDEELQAELVQMMEEDQAARTGNGSLDGDTARTERLKEIVAEHGWPTYDLVGEEGEEAAWVVAQHSDLDPEFQAEALELLRAAVDEGQASPGNLAYLEDRVRAGRGEPQLYGTQTGCTRSGKPAEPEIEDPAGLDQRREEAGLPPYDRYLRQMARVCARS